MTESVCAKAVLTKQAAKTAITIFLIIIVECSKCILPWVNERLNEVRSYCGYRVILKPYPDNYSTIFRVFIPLKIDFISFCLHLMVMTFALLPNKKAESCSACVPIAIGMRVLVVITRIPNLKHTLRLLLIPLLKKQNDVLLVPWIPEGPDSYRENPRFNKHSIVFVLFLETVLVFECICCFSYS